MDNRQKVSARWDRVWQDKNNLEEWDYLSQVVSDVLKDETPSMNEKKVIEVGSGSGRISHRLATSGAKVTLLDISDQAILEEKRLFQETNVPAKLIQGSLFQIPCGESSHDIVWNSGVVEHYLDDELRAALKEMARVCRHDGRVIVIVPYAGSILHTVGKAFIEKMAEYPYGNEYPIKTLTSDLEAISCTLVKKEYSLSNNCLMFQMNGRTCSNRFSWD
ncbi:MAG: class I SAM-dependent methyltransferase [Nitrospinales bacterium]